MAQTSKKDDIKFHNGNMIFEGKESWLCRIPSVTWWILHGFKNSFKIFNVWNIAAKKLVK